MYTHILFVYVRIIHNIYLWCTLTCHQLGQISLLPLDGVEEGAELLAEKLDNRLAAPRLDSLLVLAAVQKVDQFGPVIGSWLRFLHRFNQT